MNLTTIWDWKERNEALLWAVLEMQDQLLDGQSGEVTCCAGPPLCYRNPDEAVGAERAGCPDCLRITVEKKMAQA